MKSQVYNQAKYYEIAFSFINQKKQADLFEQFIKKYSRRKVSTVLDLACGTALQLQALAKRGYKGIGLDASLQMLKFLEEESLAKNLAIKTVKADMTNFKLEEKVDFAFIMMGSIIYAKNNQLLLSHLDSVAASLNHGGLYLLENLPLDWANPKFFKPQTWTMSKQGIKVKTTWQLLPKDPIRQIVTASLKLEVKDHGKKFEFLDKDDLKLIFPEEFKLLLAMNGKFEFLGFFARESIKLLKTVSSNNIALLRRK